MHDSVFYEFFGQIRKTIFLFIACIHLIHGLEVHNLHYMQTVRLHQWISLILKTCDHHLLRCWYFNKFTSKLADKIFDFKWKNALAGVINRLIRVFEFSALTRLDLLHTQKTQSIGFFRVQFVLLFFCLCLSVSLCKWQ